MQRRFLRKRGAAGKYPLSLLTTFAASSPKGTPYGNAVNFAATTEAVPLGKVAKPQALTEGVPTEKGCLPIGRQPFSEENKENTRPKGQSEYQNILSSL